MSESKRHPWEWVRGFSDSIIYLSVALSVIGVNLDHYFEAKEKISILRMELELEREKRKLNPKLENRLKLLQQEVDSLKLDNEVLKEDSHKPAG